MNSKLYVGNLDYGVDDSQLSAHFAQAGTVTEAVVIKDRYSGRSKGFGFVTFATAEEAQAAISMFDGKDMNGRNIVVNEARPKKENE
jgi:RNA recognition motif-containing protein